MALKRAVFTMDVPTQVQLLTGLLGVERLLRTCVLGDCFCSLADCVLGELTGQQQSDCGLYLATGDSGTLVIVGQSGRFGSYTLEDVVDETVHDAHRLRRDAGIRMDLFEHFVDVDGVTFLPPALLFLVSLGDVLLGFAGLFGRFSAGLRWHLFCR